MIRQEVECKDMKIPWSANKGGCFCILKLGQDISVLIGVVFPVFFFFLFSLEYLVKAGQQKHNGKSSSGQSLKEHIEYKKLN